MPALLTSAILRRIELDSFQRVVDIGLRVTFSIVAVIECLMTWHSAVMTAKVAAPLGIVIIFGSYAVTLGAAITILITARPQRVVAAYAGAICLTIAVVPFTLPNNAISLPEDTIGPMWSFAEPFTHLSIMAIAVWCRGRTRVAALVLIATIAGGTHWYAQNDSVPVGVDTMLALTFYALFAVLGSTVAHFMTRIAAAIDESQAQLRSTQTHASTARAELLERDEFDRFLHDHILDTLRMIALGGHVDPAAARNAAVSVLEELEARTATDAPESAPVVDALQALAEQCPLEVSISVYGSIPDSLPRTVAVAMLRATSEALRNVERHADVNKAHLTLRSGADSVSIEIHDAGVGFADDATGAGRLGIGSSIHDRMLAVGGRAHIDSAPGAGTRVQLTWRDPHHARLLHRSALLEFRDQFHAAITAGSGGLLAGAPIGCLLALPYLPHPELNLLMAVAVIGVWVAFSIWARRHEVSGRCALLAAAVAIIAPTVAALALPVGYPPGWGLWMTGAGAPVIVLVFFHRPLTEALLASTVLVGVLWTALAATPRGDFEFGLYVPAYASPVLICAGGFALRFATDSLASTMDAIREREAYAQLELDRTHIQNQVSSVRLREIAIDVHPLLTGIANGTVTPADAANRAARLEHAVRDAIISSDTTQLRRTITDLRTVGWNIDFRRSTPTSQGRTAPEPADLIEVLNGLPTPSATGHLVITLTELPAKPTQPARTSWTLLASTPPQELRAHIATVATQLDAVHTDDQDFVSLCAPVANRAPGLDKIALTSDSRAPHGVVVNELV